MKQARALDEAQETIRELKFKVRCFGVMLRFARTHVATQDAANVIDSGLLRLFAHTRGEKPLSWLFEDEQVVEP